MSMRKSKSSSRKSFRQTVGNVYASKEGAALLGTFHGHYMVPLDPKLLTQRLQSANTAGFLYCELLL